MDLSVASGLGGTPSASIKEWFLEDDNVSHCAVQIVNDLAAGRVPEGIKSAIRSCRGCAVPKPDGSPRPLGIGETLVRFVGGCVLQRVTSAARRYCLPYNLGIGVESGCELAFRIVERKLDRDGGVVSCEDEECAFNSMDRNVIFSAVFEATPAALPLINLLYSDAADIIVPTLGLDFASISNGTAFLHRIITIL